MTPTIKEWMESQADLLAPYNGELDVSVARAMGVVAGLTNVFQLLEDFQYFAHKSYMPNKPYDGTWFKIGTGTPIAFDKLLEKYLEQLGK